MANEREVQEATRQWQEGAISHSEFAMRVLAFAFEDAKTEQSRVDILTAWHLVNGANLRDMGV